MAQTNADGRTQVLLITEGTYPYYPGGVSNWCQMLVRELPDIAFTVLSLVGDLQIELRYVLPPNVVALHPVPLWGAREALENRRELSLVEIGRLRRHTTEAAVTHGFVPSFEAFLSDVYMGEETQPLGQAIREMYRFFGAYDLDTTLRSRAAWDCYVRTAQRFFPEAIARCGYARAEFSLADLTDGMTLLYHWLMPLGARLPEVEVAHAVSGGLCCLPAIASKLEHGAAFLLTEHGIYLRERYLAEANSPSSLFLKLFSLRFVRRIAQLSYALADQISPGSKYNQRWERINGAAPERLQTIYNGVDPSEFRPVPKSSDRSLVVVWMGRITPIKDLITLLRAAALVHDARPDIEFRLYGSSPAGDEAYYEACLAARTDLGIEDTVTFGGFAPSAQAAFNEGDLVVLSSISEGFPYSVVEAMLCARPVVATAVGGVPEAIEGCGLAVEPRNPDAMAQAILALMNDPEHCARLGRAAQEKAMREFNLDQCTEAYRHSYRLLAGRGATLVPAEAAQMPAPESIPQPAQTLQSLEPELALPLTGGSR